MKKKNKEQKKNSVNVDKNRTVQKILNKKSFTQKKFNTSFQYLNLYFIKFDKYLKG